MAHVNYPAKYAYQSRESAEEYDKKRFSKFTGKIVDYLEKSAIVRSLGACTEFKSLLDIPSGTGRIGEFILSRYDCRMTNADASAEMLRCARARLCEFSNFGGSIKADIICLPFGDNSFDVITCVRLMGHLPDEVKEEALAELKRVSRRYLVVFFYEKNHWLSFKRRVKLFLKPSKAPWFPVTSDQIVKLAAKFNLKLIKRNYVLFGISEGAAYLFGKSKD